MTMIRRRLPVPPLCWLVTAELCCAAAAAGGIHETGRPLFHAFTAFELHSDEPIYSIAEGPGGVLVLGGAGKVIEFDGTASREFPAPWPGALIVSIGAAEDGTIYFVSGNRAGGLAPASEDRRGFVPLEYGFPERPDVPLRFYGVSVVGNDAYFKLWDGVARWRAGEWRVWATDGVPEIFIDDGDVYVWSKSGEFGRIRDDRLIPEFSLAGHDESHWLAVRRRKDGGWRVLTDDGRILRIAADGSMKAPATIAGARPGQGRMQRGLFMEDGHCVLVTPEDLLWADSDGRIRARLGTTGEFDATSVAQIRRARDGGIWAVVHNELLRIEAAPAATRFDRFNGLGPGPVLAAARYEGVLYVAAEDGLFALDPGDGARRGARFRQVPGLQGRCGALLIHSGDLLAGGADGVYRLAGGRFERVYDTGAGVIALASGRRDPDTVLFSTGRGVGTIRRQAGGWRREGPVHAFANARFVVESGDGLLLMGGARSQLDIGVPHTDEEIHAATEAMAFSGLLVPRADVDREDAPVYTVRSFRLPTGRTGVLWWAGRPIAFAEDGIFELPPGSTDLEPLAFPAIDRDNHRIRMASASTDAAVWFALAPSGRAGAEGLWWSVIRAAPGEDRTEMLPPAFAAAAGEIQMLFEENHGSSGRVLWIGGTGGLVRLELDRLPAPPAPPVVLVRGIAPPPDGGGVYTRAPDALRIDFAAPWYQAGGAPSYQTRLDGLLGEWSEFSTLPHRIFNRPPPGDYVFRVRARLPDGRIGPEERIAFTVLPPWWLTPWAYIGYALAAVSGVTALVHRRLAVARRRNLELEALVATRTRELHTAKSAAESASQAKSAFLASMSHELRTPLNAILGFAEILRRSPKLTEDDRRRLAVIGRNGDHLLQMINEILDLSKIEAGKLSLAPRTFALRPLLDNLAETFAQRAADKGLSFQVEIASDLPASVHADDAKLRQVLYNLLGNALKFTEAGGIVFTVTHSASPPSVLHPPASNSHPFIFSVADTGIGIPSGDQNDIFEPFHQVAGGRLASQGTGLGLAISQRVVRLMGGVIQVESPSMLPRTDPSKLPEAGPGSRFWFQVFLTVVAGPADTRDPFAGRVTGYSGVRRRLLVVDDEHANRELLRAIFEPLGFTIEECADGESCLAAFARRPSDAVLLDLRMPGSLDGLKTARRLRALPGGHVPAIIAVSASVFEEDRQTAFDAGCDAFVPKPFTDERIFAALGECLDLEWIREAPPPAPEDASLPAREAEELRELARRGDIRTFRERIKALESALPECAATLARLDALAAAFQLGRLRQELRTAGSLSEVQSKAR